MAPSATTILVEACDNSTAQLMLAEQVAAQQVNLYGGGQVSNSWSSSEFSGETAYDADFRLNWELANPSATSSPQGTPALVAISQLFTLGDFGRWHHDQP